MTDLQFRVFLNLLMTSDPCPLDEKDEKELIAWAHEEANKRGYANWYQAYHEHLVKKED